METATHALFRLLVEHALDIICVLDAEGYIRFASPSFAQVLGYDLEEIMNTRAFQHVHPEDLAEVQAAFQQVQRTPRAVEEATFRYRHREGGWRFLDSRAINLLGEPGLDGILVSSRDVTERVDMERALHLIKQDLERQVEQRTTDLQQANDRLRREIAKREAAHYNLSTFFDLSQDLLCIVDTDGCFKRVSAAFEKTLGYDHETLLGRPIYDFIHPDDTAATKQEMERLVQGLPTMHFENRYRCRDGSYRWLAWSARQHEGLVYGVGRDVTERRATEQALRDSEARYRSVVSNAPVILFAVDRDGMITLSDGRALERLGLEPGELVGQSVFDLYPDEPGVTRPLRAALAGETRTWTAHLGDLHFDTHVTPLYDEDGAIDGLIGVANDITDRVRAETASQQRTVQQAAVAMLGLASWKLHADLQGLLTLAVQTVADTLQADYCKVLELLPDGDHLLLKAGVGWTEGLVGTATVDTGPNSQAGFTLSTSEPVIVEDLRMETRFSGPPLLNEHGVVSGISVIIYSADGPYGVLGVHTREQRRFSEDDIHFVQAVANLVGEAIERHRYTATLEARVRERTYQLEAANHELEAFSYSVSHDLRSPLRSLDGFSRILIEKHAGDLSAEAQRYLGRIRNNVQRMGELIDDLLQFSWLSRQELHCTRVQPEEVVRRVLDELNPPYEARDLEVVMHPLPPCQADARMLRQVYTNLLANALKFTRNESQPTIEVGAQTDGDTPTYFVRDNGVGFDMAYADKLFGVFQRLHRQEDYEGTGVGLALVQRIVHRHGGHIWADAAPGDGATFFFTLALAAHDRPDH